MSSLDLPWVWYVELRGTAAREVLRDWLVGLTDVPGLLGAELLTSPEQPQLALVASRWQPGARPPAPPTQAKAWSFEVVQSVGGFEGPGDGP